MTQLSGIGVYTGTIPVKGTQEPIAFSTNVGNYLDYFNDNFTPDTNTLVTDMNSLADDMNDLAVSLEGYTNYKGDYDASRTYAAGDSMTFTDDKLYVCTTDGTVNKSPTSDPARWHEVEKGIKNVVDDTSPELGGNLNGKGKVIFNTISAVTTGLSLDLSVSNVLKATLSADSSITFTNILSGGMIDWIIEVDAGGFTITWPTAVTWDEDGTEPQWTTGVDTAYFYSTDGGTTIKGMRVRSGADA